jgi:hypothetical protein
MQLSLCISHMDHRLGLILPLLHSQNHLANLVCKARLTA